METKGVIKLALDKLHCQDSLEFMQQQKDFSADIIFSDVPYGLGSKLVVRQDGKVDYDKATDFMNKWKMPTGEYWESWFKECFRTLKHGGYCIVYGIDRVSVIFQYYAILAGFRQMQSLYWYNIQSMPKAADLSKNIDKYFGEKRQEPITKPFHDLAEKYDGYKYSIAPMKQMNEEIMIFQKPYKSGSCLYDTLAYENGDKECCCGALNIEGNKVALVNGDEKDLRIINRNIRDSEDGWGMNNNNKDNPQVLKENGRYPSQVFIQCICDKTIIKDNGKSPYNYAGTEYNNKDTSMFNGDKPQASSNYNDVGSGEIHTNPDCPCYRLDEQSGNIQSGNSNNNADIGESGNVTPLRRGKLISRNDVGGCSKVLQKCKYEDGEFDLYMYASKVNSKEREGGCEEETLKSSGHDFGTKFGEDRSKRVHTLKRNNHPTLKPISINRKILSLFKTPNPQRILYPFAGAGSEIIGGILAGFDNWEGCEISEDYVEIANNRIAYWTDKDNSQQPNLKSKPKNPIIKLSQDQEELF